MEHIHLQERALLYRLLNGSEAVAGLRGLDKVKLYPDYEDLTKRDLIICMEISGLDYEQTVREYAKRGVTVYERVCSSTLKSAPLYIFFKSFCEYSQNNMRRKYIMNMESLNKMCRIVRTDILNMIFQAGSGHPGGSLSSVELLTGLYFGGIMKVDPENPKWEDRDYFILSKGHVAPVLYSILARKGYFDPSELNTLRKFKSILQGHPHMSCTPGLDCSSGSLGQGLSVSNGIALALKMKNKSNRVYCLLGDGEMQEGQVWEAMMTAAQHNLDNVCAILDFNGIQLDGRVEDIKDIGDIGQKWKDFGWNVIEIDGHNMEEVLMAYQAAQNCKGKPSVLIAHTVKGKGVSFMENDCSWHGTAPNANQLCDALAEING